MCRLRTTSRGHHPTERSLAPPGDPSSRVGDSFMAQVVGHFRDKATRPMIQRGVDVSSIQVATPGPGSMHWRYGGEVRGYLLLVKAGLLQLMLPGLGAGVEQHSDFFNEPWERVLRSVPEIQGTTFDWPHGAATARKIRDFHTEIKG